MDPWLEDPAEWPGLHHLLISAAAGNLNGQLKPLGYYVKVDERIWLEEPPNVVRPDLAIAGASHCQAGRDDRTLRPTKPVTIHVVTEEVHEGLLEVYDAKGRQLITGIEVISAQQ